MQNYSKVVLIGSAGVGKTCIVTRATTNFYDPDQTSTVGASFFVKEIDVNGQTAMLRIWDTAGQEKFRSLAPMYFQGAHIVLLVFSIDSKASFDDIDTWIQDIRSALDYEPIFYLVGNKADLDPKLREVTYEEAHQKAESLDAIYFETSAKLGQNINEIFQSIAERIIEIRKDENSDMVPMPTENKDKKGGCC